MQATKSTLYGLHRKTNTVSDYRVCPEESVYFLFSNSWDESQERSVIVPPFHEALWRIKGSSQSLVSTASLQRGLKLIWWYHTFSSSRFLLDKYKTVEWHLRNTALGHIFQKLLHFKRISIRKITGPIRVLKAHVRYCSWLWYVNH